MQRHMQVVQSLTLTRKGKSALREDDFSGDGSAMALECVVVWCTVSMTRKADRANTVYNVKIKAAS